MEPISHSAKVDAAPNIVRVEVAHRLDEALKSRWARLAADAVYPRYQSVDWVEAWLMTAGAHAQESPFILQGIDKNDRPIVLIPLVQARRYGVRVAKFPGGKHANFNFPLVRADVALTAEDIGKVFDCVRLQKHGIDLLHLEALPAVWYGMRNPLLLLPHRIHPAQASILSLAGPDVSNDYSYGRKSKKLRSTERKIVKLGVALRQSVAPADIRDTLVAFRRQKTLWFQQRGLPDSFAPAGVYEFFFELFVRAADARLYVLDIDEHPMAIAGLLAADHRASLMFLSYDTASPLASLGPGTRLVHLLMSRLREEGFAELDFGLGEAAYKMALGAWTQDVYTIIRPINAKGLAGAAVVDLARAGKRFIKASPSLFAIALRAKRYWRVMTGRAS